MSVPILTIPEAAYDITAYTANPHRYNQRSSLLVYLVRLTHGSAFTLTLLYIVGYFVIKPLLQTKADRHYEFLEFFRGKLREAFLKVVGRVSYVPVVAINRNGKLYADAVVQTNHDLPDTDKLNQGQLVSKLLKLNKVLNECTSYCKSEIPHYDLTSFVLKDFQNKADMVYFNSTDLFSKLGDAGIRKRNLATDIKNDLRSIKGLYMSGQA